MARISALQPAPGRGLAARLSQRRLAGSRCLAAPRNIQLHIGRRALSCRAHAGHSHAHTHQHEPHSHSEHQDIAPSCGHDHGHARDLQNPAHRLLKAVFDATRLTDAAAWLESSLAATIGKVVLFVLAAGTAGWAASGWATSAAAAALARSVSVAATAGVYLLAGIPAAVDLSYDVTSGHVDTHVLMNLAVLGTLATGHALEGALLLVLFQSSHALEHLLTERAQGNLAALYDAIPKEAVLVSVDGDGSPDLASAHSVLAADVEVGAHLLVKPGEQVPLDGVVVHGRAMVSSEHITGESLPVLCRSGDEAAAGSLNRDGVLVLRALRRADESTPARIAKLAMDAQAKRPQLRTWLDEFGEVYSKAVIGGALGLMGLLLLTGVPLLGAAGQRGAFYRAMGFLTVASPCALVMVPLAYVSAIAAIASRGILVKGGRVLDSLARCNTVAFDKTGTLTTGSLSCTSIRPLGPSSSSSSGGSSRGGSSSASILGVSPREAAAAKQAALSAAVALSLRSRHPVSDAIVLAGQQAGLDGSGEDVLDFELVAGGGVHGTMAGSGTGRSRQQYRAAFGSVEFVGAQLSAEERLGVQRLADGQGTSGVLSVLVLEPSKEPASTNGNGSSSSSSSTSSSGSSSSSSAFVRSVWVMSFEDSIRTQSAGAVRELTTGSWTGSASQSNRLAVMMLTGDNEASAQRIARKLGIRNVSAALSPQEKLDRVRELSGHDSEADSTPPSTSSRGSSRSSGRSSSSKAGRGGNGKAGQGVIMVGDGINDAPALAAADVGIAIASTATAAASLAADVIVVNSTGIAAVPLLLKIAKETQAVIRQNLILAVGSIAALSLPTVLGWVPLWFAVMLHEGSTLLVALNSLRLLRFGSGLRNWRDASQQQQPAQPGAAAEGEGDVPQERSRTARTGGPAAPVIA
ncbi:putative cadmium/zinc-transporting ATPase HMA1 [Chlorella vulgaris]